MLAVLVCLVCASTTVLAAQEWWRTAVFYQIYPRSFKDSDNDGVGDINGITSKVDYLADIGVNAVWLSPIYKSPMADFGYDISNFTDVDPLFGSMADLLQLIAELKSRNIKVVLDFVPNHSSDEHPWFNMSVYQQGDYSDYYIWRNQSGTNASDPQVPNNWRGVFSGSAWEWSEVRQQYYLHHFVAKQPDLNYRNPKVVKDMQEVLRFWMNQGIDGFRVDAIEHLAEDDRFLDEPLIDPNSTLSYDNLNHIYTMNQDLTYEVVAGWSRVLNDQEAIDGIKRVMFLEVYNTIPTTMRYYGNSSTPFQMPFNFYLLDAIDKGTTAKDLLANFNDWLDAMPAGLTANWVVGNHDNSRVATRAGPEMADSINMILAMLPGIMVTYNGDEFGMTDTFLRFEDSVDPRGTLLGPDLYTTKTRDPARTPLQWDATVNAGFSKQHTWLPANPDYWWLNVAGQLSSATSHLNVYKSLTKLRQSTTFLGATTKYEITAPENNTLIIKRWSDEGETYVLIASLACIRATTFYLPTNVTQMVVNVSSINSEYTAGDVVTLSSGVTLRPKSAVILQTIPDAPREPTSAATCLAVSSASIIVLLCYTIFVYNI